MLHMKIQNKLLNVMASSDDSSLDSNDRDSAFSN